MKDSVSDYVLDKPDLLDREKQVLQNIITHSGFKVSHRLGDSRYWNQQYAGAVFYQGTYQTKPAVLKIQGTKPPVSEIDQITSFSAQNRSRLIRPPHLYTSIPWSETDQFEALILEHIDGMPIVPAPATASQIKQFFHLYIDYRRHCRQRPWLPKPTHSISTQIHQDFTKWRHIRKTIYPKHPHLKLIDDNLIDQAIKVLIKKYQGTKWDFCHGHLSAQDFVQTKRGETILFSNLFWRYRPPLYDAVFAQHWHLLCLSSLKSITQKDILSQQNLWFKYLHNLPQTQGKHRKLYLQLALLERAAAALNLDVLTLDPQAQTTPYQFTRLKENITQILTQIK